MTHVRVAKAIVIRAHRARHDLTATRARRVTAAHHADASAMTARSANDQAVQAKVVKESRVLSGKLA
jgi:hypothetical protein